MGALILNLIEGKDHSQQNCQADGSKLIWQNYQVSGLKSLSLDSSLQTSATALQDQTLGMVSIYVSTLYDYYSILFQLIPHDPFVVGDWFAMFE